MKRTTESMVFFAVLLFVSVLVMCDDELGMLSYKHPGLRSLNISILIFSVIGLCVSTILMRRSSCNTDSRCDSLQIRYGRRLRILIIAVLFTSMQLAFSLCTCGFEWHYSENNDLIFAVLHGVFHSLFDVAVVYSIFKREAECGRAGKRSAASIILFAFASSLGMALLLTYFQQLVLGYPLFDILNLIEYIHYCSVLERNVMLAHIENYFGNYILQIIYRAIFYVIIYFVAKFKVIDIAKMRVISLVGKLRKGEQRDPHNVSFSELFFKYVPVRIICFMLWFLIVAYIATTRRCDPPGFEIILCEFSLGLMMISFLARLCSCVLRKRNFSPAAEVLFVVPFGVISVFLPMITWQVLEHFAGFFANSFSYDFYVFFKTSVKGANVFIYPVLIAAFLLFFFVYRFDLCRRTGKYCTCKKTRRR